MLVSSNRLIGCPVFSVQASGQIASVSKVIIDPDSLKIIAFRLNRSFPDNASILDVKSIREYNPDYGIIIDNNDEIVADDEIIKIQDVLSLHFEPIGLKVETKKGSKLGHVEEYTVAPEDFIVQQLIVKRPALKALIDPELTIPRTEIVKITDDKIIVRDEEKVIKARAEKEDFIPNFVNPFRKKQPDYAPTDTDKE